MKVNIIFSQKNESSLTDANILVFLFRKIKHNIEPKFVDFNNFKCENASINIFIGVVNPLLTDYAKTNILLFDDSFFRRTNMHTLKHIDYIFTKTSEITHLLQDSVSKSKLINIGWRSSDLNISNQSRDYNKMLLFCYDRTQSHIYRKIIQAWNDDERTIESGAYLHVINFNLAQMKESDITNNTIIVEKNMSQENFETVFNKYGTHICLEEHFLFHQELPTEVFSHASSIQDP